MTTPETGLIGYTPQSPLAMAAEQSCQAALRVAGIAADHEMETCRARSRAASLERSSTNMTEREVRALGLGQLTASLARSALAGQRIRLEALETLLSDAGKETAARAAVIAVCRRHPDARWWLWHQRSFGSARTLHWATVLGEEVNQEMTVRKGSCEQLGQKDA